jgi:sugar phosphate isomerase/epimerase
MRKHSSVIGVLDYSHFLRALEDGVGPTTIFEIEDQDKMFNLE